MEASEPLDGLSITEQGAGALNLEHFLAIVKERAQEEPFLQVYPENIDIRPPHRPTKSTASAEAALNKTEQTVEFLE